MARQLVSFVKDPRSYDKADPQIRASEELGICQLIARAEGRGTFDVRRERREARKAKERERWNAWAGRMAY
jgi:hypothetical protein